MKKLFILVAVLIASSVGNAKSLNCKYLSNTREHINGFLLAVDAKFDCDGGSYSFIGDNGYVSCKPQFALANFVDHLTIGEAVKFELADRTITDIGGGSSLRTFVNSAKSESGQLLEPAIFQKHGEAVKCKTTQIEVWEN